MRALHWFRTDLRISDNTALIEAAKKADALAAIFIITPETWRSHDAAPVKVDFILRQLKSLSEHLAKHGISLMIREVPRFEDCPALLLNMAKALHIDILSFNRQYEVDEQKRDDEVKRLFATERIEVIGCHDRLIVSPGEILNQKNEPYKVFTPFKKAWLKKVCAELSWIPANFPKKDFQLLCPSDSVPSYIKGFKTNINAKQWPASQHAAHEALREFVATDVSQYSKARDFPALDQTSHLSHFLAQGMLSPRQCFKALHDHYGDGFLEKPGCDQWVSELIWREFYTHILYHHPDICRNKAFNQKNDAFPWSYNESLFQAWCEGQTGYPIVDAAMRQLNQTGWMHNRLRMIAASFLTKILQIDWRWGERYFMQHLIDGDFASNNGGWQWSSSTGTDACPYFRIFNPVSQSKKFDPDGEFIRQYCPELADLNSKDIHEPKAEQVEYPERIVDYSQMRQDTLKKFKELK